MPYHANFRRLVGTPTGAVRRGGVPTAHHQIGHAKIWVAALRIRYNLFKVIFVKISFICRQKKQIVFIVKFLRW